MLNTIEPRKRPPAIYRPGQYEVPRPVPRSAAMAPPHTSHEGGSSGGWIAGVCVVLLSAMLFGLSMQKDFLLGQMAAMAMGPLALLGMWRGLVRQVCMFAAIGAMAIFGPALIGIAAETAASAGWQWSGLNTYLAGIGILFTFFLTSATIARSVRRRLVAHRPALATADRMLGAVLGAGEGAFVLLSLCWLAAMTQPTVARIRNSDTSSVNPVATRIVGVLAQISEEAGTGWLGDIVRSTNLIEQTPVLREMIERLNAGGGLDLGALGAANPEQLQNLLNSAGGQPGDQQRLLDEMTRNIREQNEAYQRMPRPTKRE